MLIQFGQIDLVILTQALDQGGLLVAEVVRLQFVGVGLLLLGLPLFATGLCTLVEGLAFVVGTGDAKRLTIRDAQHEYVFTGS